LEGAQHAHFEGGGHLPIVTTFATPLRKATVTHHANKERERANAATTEKTPQEEERWLQVKLTGLLPYPFPVENANELQLGEHKSHPRGAGP
jgi:hypothetical protein